jgi:cysteine desulfurase/selenocysteine lyase
VEVDQVVGNRLGKDPGVNKVDSSRRQFVGLCLAAPVLAREGTFAGAQRGETGTTWPSAFPALRQSVHGRPLTYLDSAATTLRPQSVIDALVQYYSSDNANPSRVHTLASRAADHLAAARQTVARFINAADSSEIVFVRGTTEGINLVASAWGATNLRGGDEIVLSVAEHSSNLMPWTRLARERDAHVRVVDVTDEGRLEPEAVKKALSARTRLVALTHVSNVLGAVNPIKEICALSHAAGVRVVVDGAQGAPHVKIDVLDLGCDFYVFSGHKMLGPMATGALWGRRELLDSIPPYHVGSNMAHAVEFDHAELEHGAQKFQAGTPDVAGPIGLAAAIRFFEDAGDDAWSRHDQSLVQHGLERLMRLPRLRLIGPHSADNRVPVFTFVIEGRTATDVARALDEQGIAVRAGDMAALPLLKRFGASEAVRASAYVYSTLRDIDRLADALHGVGK